MIRAGQLLRIDLVDDVVIGNNQYTSLKTLGYFL